MSELAPYMGEVELPPTNPMMRSDTSQMAEPYLADLPPANPMMRTNAFGEEPGSPPHDTESNMNMTEDAKMINLKIEEAKGMLNSAISLLDSMKKTEMLGGRRCKKGSRKNKKTGKCRKTCKPGFKRSRKTHHCQKMPY